MKNYLSIPALFSLALIILSCSTFKPEKKVHQIEDIEKTYLKYIDAIQAEDRTAMKSLMSKNSLRLLKNLAKQRNMTTDQFLGVFQKKRDFETKLRGIKIEGDEAMLEDFQGENGWLPVVLVYQNSWKYAADKTQEKRDKQFIENK